MNFIYEFEEKWILKEDLNVSSDFLKKILNNDKKIIEVNKNNIKFKFVGILVYKKEILIILPKYSKELHNESEKLECIKKIIKVFKRIPNKFIKDKNDSFFISNNIANNEISEIALADYIIKDFRNYGCYTKKDKIKSINNNSNINWKNTINSFNPIIINDQVLYTEYISENFIMNNSSFISALHLNVYNYLLVKYKDLLGYNSTKLSLKKTKNSLSKLGNKKYILDKIKKELEYTFSDRETNVLKAIYNFFENNDYFNNNKLSIFGTTSFELVWEYICKYIFDDKYRYFKNDIPFPEWYVGNDIKYESKKNNLIPDIISIHNQTMFILDAKYYSISISNQNIIGNPGNYDIIKQYIYEMALNDPNIIKNYNNSELSYSNTISALIYPKIMQENFSVFGYTKHPVFKNNKIINNIYLSPNYAYNLFLDRKKIDSSIYEKIAIYNQKNNRFDYNL